MQIIEADLDGGGRALFRKEAADESGRSLRAYLCRPLNARLTAERKAEAGSPELTGTWEGRAVMQLPMFREGSCGDAPAPSSLPALWRPPVLPLLLEITCAMAAPAVRGGGRSAALYFKCPYG